MARHESGARTRDARAGGTSVETTRDGRVRDGTARETTRDPAVRATRDRFGGPEVPATVVGAAIGAIGHQVGLEEAELR